MSMFSSVDAAADPRAAIAYLDQTARAAWRMKHYAMAAHALRQPDGPVLDLGCGAGHDLRLFAGAGLATVGVDPSAVLLSEAWSGRRRCVPGARGGRVVAVRRSVRLRRVASSGC